MLSIDIKKQLGDLRLDIALEAQGGVTAIFGPSGSGKTSLINAVAGLLRPDDGQIILDGNPLFDSATNLPPAQRNIGYVFQDARLFPHMSVLANLRYGGRADEERVIETLRLAPLLNRRPRDLSGGEKQRVALGRALMRGPDLLLMDEPLSALDARLKAEILPFFEELRDETKLPILYVTHSITEVARLATTLSLIENGRIMRSGPVAQVMADPKAVPLLGPQDAGALITATVQDTLEGLTTLSFDGGTLMLPGTLGPKGKRLRLRVPAQDVILSVTRPDNISALNVLECTVTEVAEGKGPGVAVGLRCGSTALLSRITARSAKGLGLRPGAPIYAIVKAMAVAPSNVGG